MKIERNIVKIRDLVDKFIDNGDEGVVGYGGNLDIRPPYQREFIYGPSDQETVIDSVVNGFPLGIMYWAVKEDGRLEVLDGQQRILSICNYYKNKFGLKQGKKPIFYDNLSQDKSLEKRFLDYELDVYFCDGAQQEKLAWFNRINIAGKELTKQEVRNAAFTGPWLESAKRYFSKSTSSVDNFSKYLLGTKNRQAYLETAIKWASEFEFGKTDIEGYMAKHQFDDDAEDMWRYFLRVMTWIEHIFIKYRASMKGIQWGSLYNSYGKWAIDNLNSDDVEKKVSEMMKHPDIQDRKGIYLYIFDRDEKHLNIRAFEEVDRIAKYEEQSGKCNMCGKEFKLEEMHADHIVPFSKGGMTEYDNLQMLCAKDNWAKAGR